MVMATATAMVLAMARDADRRSHRTTRLALPSLLVLAAVGTPVPADAQTWRITPSVSLSETLSDNINLAPSGQRRSDLVTDITPSIRIDGSRGRTNLHLVYQMHNLIYARQSENNNTQHFLSATGALEAIENWLFIDASASVTQEPISAFGSQPSTNVAVSENRNRSQSQTYSISPHIRGQFGAIADYLLRYNFTTYSSKAIEGADYQVGELVGTLGGGTSFVNLRWAVEGNAQTIDYDRDLDTEANRVRAVLTYQFDPQFRASINGGRESNNYATFDTVTTNTYGAGFDWRPSERTSVNGSWERRFFGSAWSYGFVHRTPRTSWNFSDSRQATNNAEERARAGGGVAFDLLFNALASRIPDPVARGQEAQRLLAQGGVPADLNIPGDFVTSRVFVDRTQQAAFTLIGARNNLTVSIFRSVKDAVGIGSGVPDDFDLASKVTESGVSAVLSHRLTPLSGLTAFASYRRASGADTSLESRQGDFNLLYVTQFGPKTSGSLGYRYVRFLGTSDGNPGYRENAITASVTLQF